MAHRQLMILGSGSAALTLLLLLFGCSGDDETTGLARRPGEVLPVLVEVDVPYSSSFDLDVYHPDATGPWPVAVVFHGGEVLKSSVRSYASAVAERGVVVFVPEYSSTPEQVSDVLHLGGEDAVCAMRFARAHASDFDGHGDRIVVAGASYGANVAALMVVAADEFEGGCVAGSEVSPAADGLVGLDGMYDFTELPRELGFHEDYTVEEMERASAITYVEPAELEDDTPIELFTGREAVTQHQAALFSDSLTAAGYEVVLVPQPELAHGAYGGVAPGTVEALTDMAFG
ncbi:MAG: alpha/beta hydrolase [Acidimicrobiia bacterium]|nr:alpha/beta hydrolase [Acidimicrobiia bacterium]